jgi:poly(hydroxyalkanoate) depolymerase family esterase
MHDMLDNLPPGLRKATQLTGAGRLMEATAAIQRMLGGQTQTPSAENPKNGSEPFTIDGVAERVEPVSANVIGRTPLLGKVNLRDLIRRKAGGASGSVAVPNGAQFLAATFTNDAGSRPYKLYVPSGYRTGQPAALVVMLHGCTQSPDDFAAGTRMNEVAEQRSVLVVYPGQTGAANMQKCWNWFRESDQLRGAGEPSLIAGITREVMADYTVDPQRVYVAGLSAGGAAAAIMGNTYSDLYTAIGVHSGLACGAARDMPSAFTAMRHGSSGNVDVVGTRERIVPTIVFHGDRDMTVDLRNADFVVAQAAGVAMLRTNLEEGMAPGGHTYSRSVHRDASGRPVIEQWVVHGAGHAWAGGSSAGSYTDPQGPDATREMMRFFLDHVRNPA